MARVPQYSYLMNDLEQRIIQALSQVQDPDLKNDLVSLEMIKDLVVGPHTITFTLVLTTPACPLQEMLKQACIKAIQSAVGATWKIVIAVAAKVTTNRSQCATLPGIKNIIAIASGKGGVGKSTVATQLALALAHYGVQVGLLDADLFGPSIPTMWGCETAKVSIIQREEKKYIVPIERQGIKLLSIGFLTRQHEALVWRGPMASAAFRQLVQETDWGALDYLLIDLPPGTSDIHLTLAQTVPVTGVVLVTTPHKIALIDVVKAIAMFQKERIQMPILGLIENMAYFRIPNVPNAQEDTLHYIFGKEGGKALAATHGIPFLGQIPLLTDLCLQQHAAGPVLLAPFQAIAQSLAQCISIRNAL